MGEVSHADKMRMQTLREQECGVKAIICAYPCKEWKLSLSRTASSWCQLGSFSTKMAPQHTRHVSRRSGCTQTVLRSLIKTLATQFPRSQPLGYHVWGGHAGKVSQTAAEAKDDRRAESRYAINMGRHATRADQQGRQGLRQTPEGMRAGQWWTLWTHNVTLKVALVMLCWQ